MKKSLLTLAAAMGVGVLAFFLSREFSTPDTHPVLLDSLPELAWLRSDLKLTAGQFSEVEQLHRNYRPVCEDMCLRIVESQAIVAKLAAAQGYMSEELAKSIENYGRVISECKRGMLEHLYQTASLMDERQARRYLEATLPLALDSVHGSTATRNHE